MRRPAVGEDVDDAFGLSRKVRLLRRERIGKPLRGPRAVGQTHRAENSRQAQHTHAHAATAEEFAARQGQMLQIGRVMIHRIQSIRMLLTGEAGSLLRFCGAFRQSEIGFGPGLRTRSHIGREVGLPAWFSMA